MRSENEEPCAQKLIKNLKVVIAKYSEQSPKCQACTATQLNNREAIPDERAQGLALLGAEKPAWTNPPLMSPTPHAPAQEPYFHADIQGSASRIPKAEHFGPPVTDFWGAGESSGEESVSQT